MAAAVRMLAALLASLATQAAPAAGTVADPTQPPTAQPPRAAASPAAADAPAPEARLQMVIRGPGEQRVALIGGQRVRVGDRIELDGTTARVAAIHDDRVLLQRGAQRETLELLPTIAVPTPAAPRQAPPASRPTPASAR